MKQHPPIEDKRGVIVQDRSKTNFSRFKVYFVPDVAGCGIGLAGSSHSILQFGRAFLEGGDGGRRDFGFEKNQSIEAFATFAATSRRRIFATSYRPAAGFLTGSVKVRQSSSRPCSSRRYTTNGIGSPTRYSAVPGARNEYDCDGASAGLYCAP